MYICIYVYMYICKYVYMYMYMYMYIYVHNKADIYISLTSYVWCLFTGNLNQIMVIQNCL